MMITSEVREELKQIQSELKKVFPANRHEIRDLPGGQRKWVYLKWQTIRERLDEVCPDWIIDEGGNPVWATTLFVVVGSQFSVSEKRRSHQYRFQSLVAKATR